MLKSIGVSVVLSMMVLIAGCCIQGLGGGAALLADDVVVSVGGDEKCPDGGVCPIEAPKAHASVYQSHRSKSVTRTRTERVRRSGGSSGILQSHGSNGSSRRERRAERRSYGSAGTSFSVKATVSYGSNGGG